MSNKNFIEKYPYLNEIARMYSLSLIPTDQDHFIQYFRYIDKEDNDFEFKQFKVLLKRALKLFPNDLTFINKLKETIAERNIINKAQFNSLKKEIEEALTQEKVKKRRWREIRGSTPRKPNWEV